MQPIDAAAAFLHGQPASAAVADFGCGDAALARMAPQETVHSLDLLAAAPGVIACNMAATPLGARARAPVLAAAMQHDESLVVEKHSHRTAACAGVVVQKRGTRGMLQPSLEPWTGTSVALCSATTVGRNSVLPDGAGTASVDIAIFCLALMGTDYPAFLAEAHPVLKPGGRLWVAEVCRRCLPFLTSMLHFPAWRDLMWQGCAEPATGDTDATQR